ncbi:MAG: Ig-like domain repeat protein [Methanosphaera sp.]|nr:Ig-like domain repeat protein [Methanosphaera sp.]
MSNKKIISVFIVLFILLIGLSAINASNETTCDDGSLITSSDSASTVSSDTINTQYTNNEEKNLKTENKNVKQAPGDKIDLTMEADDVTCNWGETATLNMSLYTTDTHQQVYPTEGVVMTFVDNDIVSTHNLSHASIETMYDTTQLDPGVYDLYYQYTASLVYESAESYNTLTINHQYDVTTPTTSLDYSVKTATSTPLTLECSDYYGYGDINIYIDGTLVDTVTDVDYDQHSIVFDDSLINPQVKNSYTWTLEFIPYIDTITVNSISGIVTCRDYPIRISTTNSTITADVGDVITINYGFNDTVADGNVSIAYGSSVDNTTSISSGGNSINFDTEGYMQGEYILELSYYNSSIYDEDTTNITLYLYQPTTITADKDEIDIILGSDNTYTINFETSLDVWDDVIWGSVDIYIDDEVIDTLVVDDESGNIVSFTLDDYNMEDLTPGEHTLRAVFTSDDEYIRQSSTSVTLSVSGDLTIELPQNITTNTTNAISVPSNVTFNNQPVNIGILSYYINSTLAGTLDLSTGTTKTIANNYNPGTYTLRVDYNDQSNIYPAQSNTTTLYITSNTSIQTQVLNNTIRNTTINIALTDDKNNNFEGLVNITLPNGSVMQNVQVPSTGLNISFNDLANGSNTFTIIYPENEVYKGNTSTITVDVVLLNSTTTATVSNNTIDNTTINIQVLDEKTGSPVNGGIVEVINTANNLVVGTATIASDGTATIVTSINAEGTYTLQVNYKGNEEYNTSSTTVNNLIVVKRESELNTQVNNNTLGNTTITVTLLDPATSTPLANAPITITLPNGTQVNTYTDTNGQINTTLNIPVGENIITVDYPGSEKYNSSTDEITINVAQRPSAITANITNNTIRNTTVTVAVNDKTTGTPITSGDIQITDANDEIIATGTLTESNTITLTTNIDTSGVYTLRVEYLGNTNYTASSTTLEDVSVTKRESQLNTTLNNATKNDTQITITLHDPATDTPIANAPVTVSLPNGTTIEAVTDENGTAIITPDLPVGENTITITYPGNEEYNTTTITETINITQRESLTIATLNNNTIQNTTATVTVRDKTTGTPVTTGEVTITNTDNNEIIARASLDSSTIIIPLNINIAGDYNLRVDYLGNTNYTSSNATLTDVTIVKRKSAIEITTLNDTVADTRVNITVKDPVTNNTLVNAPISITLPNGTTINTHTGSTGTTTVTLELPSDTQTITVTYDGSNTYNTISTYYTLNITKLPSIITVAKQTGYIGENITLTANITDAEGNPINGGRVIFKLNGITLKDTNDETIYADVTNGVANISYHIPTSYQAKTYKLEAVYAGNSIYDSSRSNTPLVNLKQRQAQLTIQTNTTVQVDQTLNINVNITDKRDPTRSINGYVIFKIDGLTLKDENGDTIQIQITNNTAGYNYTIGHQYSARKHTITAVLVNDTYVRSQTNVTFNVTQTTANIQLNTPKLNANNQVQLTGTITDEAGHTLTGQNTALVKLNGQTLKTSSGNPQYYTIHDGNIDITLPELEYKHDTYQIEVVTGERNAFTGARNNTTLTITNTKTLKTATITTQEFVNINPERTIVQIGQTNTINIKVTDSMNKNIQKGKITFTSNGKTLSQTNIKNGQATLDHKYTKKGIYNITANYHDSTGTYTDTKKQFTIQIINPQETKTVITATDTEATVGETITYTSFFTTQEGYKIQTGTAKITINNKTTTHKIQDGIITIPITLNKTGKHKITITYNEAKITCIITVNKKTPKINIVKSTITAGKNNNLTCSVTTTDNVPLNEGKIQWKINGITLKNRDNTTLQTTVKDGTSTLSYDIPVKWAGKQINITATYTGSNNYNIKQVTSNATIAQLKATAMITLPKTIYTKDNITIQVKITDKNTGKEVPNQKIAVKINGKTISTPRTNNGTCNLTYKLPLLKTNRTHNITIVYGNQQYQRLDATQTFTIQKTNTTINLKDQTIKKGNPLHIKTLIKDSHNETMLRNDTICIKLNQKTILNTRIKNGLLDFTLPTKNYKARTYQLTIKLGDNYYYNGFTKNLKLKITN